MTAPVRRRMVAALVVCGACRFDAAPGGIGCPDGECPPGLICCAGVCREESEGECPDDMVPVAAGAFMMGCNEELDAQCDSNEFPYHEVTLSAYSIDRTEVTQHAYAACVTAGACAPPTCSYGGGDNPVVCVNWQKAAAYCAWAGKELPTEAEWEKAARGDDGRVYPWGDEPPDCYRAVSYDCDGCCDGTEPVGSNLAGASPYGALDMAGNVWEWVADWYGEDYFASSPGEDPPGPSSGSYRVVRGGSWVSGGASLRASYRIWSDPTCGHIYSGFRCASHQ